MHGKYFLYTENWTLAGIMNQDKLDGKCTITYQSGIVENG